MLYVIGISMHVLRVLFMQLKHFTTSKDIIMIIVIPTNLRNNNFMIVSVFHLDHKPGNIKAKIQGLLYYMVYPEKQLRFLSMLKRQTTQMYAGCIMIKSFLH